MQMIKYRMNAKGSTAIYCLKEYIPYDYKV